jgi:hypothetical protein
MRLVCDSDCGREGGEFLGGGEQEATALFRLETPGEAAKFHRPAKITADPIVV